MTAALLATTVPFAAAPEVASADPISELQGAQEQVAESNRLYEEATERVEQVQGQIEANEERIDEIEGQLPEVREHAAESMRTLYKMQQGSGGLVELLLSADSFYELLTTIQYLDVISNQSNDAVAELVALSTELEHTRDSLDVQMEQAKQERQAASDALADAEAARDQLQAQIAAQAAAEEAERKAAIEASKKAREEAEKAEAAQDESDDAEDTGSTSNESDDSTDEPPTFTTGNGNQAEIEVPSSPDPGPVDTPSEKDVYVAEWGARINAYLAGSPLAGQGETFAEAAWTYGCDPRFSPAIAMVESTLGRYCFKPHNAWGWGSSSWGSWEEAIWDHVAGLASMYGGQLTYEGAQMYCPPNADHWYSSVLANMQRI